MEPMLKSAAFSTRNHFTLKRTWEKEMVVATLEELAEQVKKARAEGVATGSTEDRLKGGRLWTEFMEAAKAQSMSEKRAERYLRDRKAG
jgi:hypothetical protein